MTKAVLFDMDGVLVDSYEMWFHLMRGVAEKLGYPEISRTAFEGSWGQGISDDVRKFYTKHTEAQIEEEYALLHSDYSGRHIVDPAAGSVFSELRSRGRSLAVITNTPTSMAKTVLASAKLAPDLLVGGNDVENGKPAPDMVLKALAFFGVEASEAVVVGDTHNDRDAAAAAGVRFIGLKIDGNVRIEKLAEVLEFT